MVSRREEVRFLELTSENWIPALAGIARSQVVQCYASTPAMDRNARHALRQLIGGLLILRDGTTHIGMTLPGPRLTRSWGRQCLVLRGTHADVAQALEPTVQAPGWSPPHVEPLAAQQVRLPRVAADGAWMRQAMDMPHGSARTHGIAFENPWDAPFATVLSTAVKGAVLILPNRIQWEEAAYIGIAVVPRWEPSTHWLCCLAHGNYRFVAEALAPKVKG